MAVRAAVGRDPVVAAAPTTPRTTTRQSLDLRRQVAFGPERGLRPVGHVDAPEDVREVGLHGAFADAEATRDLLVRVSRRHETQDLFLARAQLLLGAHVARLEQDARRLRIERRVAGGGGTNRAEKL